MNMKLTERDRLVLIQSARFPLWFGLLLWTLRYSFWLALAFVLYLTFNKTLGLKHLTR
jgi:hypothetical protein